MAFGNFRLSEAETQAWVAQQQARASASWMGNCLATASGKLDDFLYDGNARPEPVSDYSRPEDSTAPGACRHCGVQLSAVEQKLGRCLSCGKGSHHAGAATDEPGLRRQVTVGL